MSPYLLSELVQPGNRFTNSSVLLPDVMLLVRSKRCILFLKIKCLFGAFPAADMGVVVIREKGKRVWGRQFHTSYGLFKMHSKIFLTFSQIPCLQERSA